MYETHVVWTLHSSGTYRKFANQKWFFWSFVQEVVEIQNLNGKVCNKIKDRCLLTVPNPHARSNKELWGLVFIMPLRASSPCQRCVISSISGGHILGDNGNLGLPFGCLLTTLIPHARSCFLSCLLKYPSPAYLLLFLQYYIGQQWQPRFVLWDIIDCV